MYFVLTHEFTQFHKCRGGITENVKGFRVFFRGKADTCLRAGDFQTGCHFGYTRIVEITLHFDPEAF